MESGHHHLANETDLRGVIPCWNSSILGMGIEMPPIGELNCSSGQLSDCFFSSNWDDPPSLDHNNDDRFESALSSIVSSPVVSGAAARDGFIIRELIGRLGNICNSGDVSPKSHNASCYNTPLNSPPKLNLSEAKPRANLLPIAHLPSLHRHPGFSPLNADPEFVERAARFSCFGPVNLAGSGPALFDPEFLYGSSLPKLEPQELPSQLNCELKSGPENVEIGDSREGSSVSELNPPTGQQTGGRTQNDAISRKRKSNAKSKGWSAPAKEENVVRENVDDDDDELPNAKRTKKRDEDANKNETNDNSERDENGQEKQNKIKETAKPPEPPKDFIHVRARRGQATDSHSLAERVRREKISERMKFLQDLVPGCNKVTGKAVVLDEIINYVQSLQRQVEFLSMKLSTVNPHLELNMDAILSKDFFQSRGSFQSTMYPSVTTAAQAQAFPYGYNQPQSIQPNSVSGAYCGSDNLFGMMTHLNQSVQRNPSSQLASIDGCCKTFGADDLHSIVQMGLSQNLTERSEGTNKPTTTAMKVEL